MSSLICKFSIAIRLKECILRVNDVPRSQTIHFSASVNQVYTLHFFPASRIFDSIDESRDNVRVVAVTICVLTDTYTWLKILCSKHRP